MAKKATSKKAAPKTNDEKVVRIKADASASKKPKAKAKAADAAVTTVKSDAAPAKAVKPAKAKRKTSRGGVFRAIGGYFKGAWVELRQVRWPNRRATWGLTGAVLAYSAFFIVVVLLLDAGFKYLFDLILK